AVPLLRAAAVRHRRRVAQPGLARAAVVRRGVAQQPPRVPHRRGARAAPVAARRVGRRDLGARAYGAGLGRRARQPGARSGQARSMRTAPLRHALAEALPERPFRLELWDGTELPSTNGGGPTFRVRSPIALSHALRAPGQLGLGRAYVAGALDVDDVDAALDLLDGWAAPPI